MVRSLKKNEPISVLILQAIACSMRERLRCKPCGKEAKQCESGTYNMNRDSTSEREPNKQTSAVSRRGRARGVRRGAWRRRRGVVEAPRGHAGANERRQQTVDNMKRERESKRSEVNDTERRAGKTNQTAERTESDSR